MALKTRVTMLRTTILFHNALKNKIDEVEALGKANAKEARDVVIALCPRNTYISKSTKPDTFWVDSAQLLSLKE